MLPRIFLLSLAGAAVLAATSAKPAPLEFRWRGTVDPQALVDVQNSLGEVTAEVTSGREVEVVAVYEGTTDDAALEVVQRGGGVAVRMLASMLAPIPRVHLRVKVPRGVRLRIVSVRQES
jgi:hypothetical protein